MGPFNPSEPLIADYYEDLGISQHASPRDIRLAFCKLAKKHHPDKQAPGTSTDAYDFRKVGIQKPMIREAYEFLNDKNKRAAYDQAYFALRDQWTAYREWQKVQCQYEAKIRADEEQRAARARAEQERKAAEAERARRMEEERRAAREKAERERTRKEKEKLAEERSHEAARRAREEQERAAKERLRRDKIREAERRSEEAARKVRIEQEQAAQERLKSILIQEKQNALRRNWAQMREAADHRAAHPVRPAPSRSPRCTHPHFGWPKKNGRERCCIGVSSL
ncbi:hypothetical protein AAE478_002060 [Parahypoxylon ruwenzoriense]